MSLGHRAFRRSQFAIGVAIQQFVGEMIHRLTPLAERRSQQPARPKEVAQHVRNQVRILSPGGGFVFSTVHNVQDDVPIENFMAMWETFQDNCKY